MGSGLTAGSRHRDAGITLIELIVTMALTSIVFAALGAVVTSVFGGARQADVRTGTSADARIAVEAMTRTLRVATPPGTGAGAFASATPTSVSFYANLQRGAGATPTAAADGSVTLQPPTLVTYQYDASPGDPTYQCLTETQTPAGGSAGAWTWTTGGVTKCLARTTTPPTFTYYASGLLTSGTPPTPVPAVADPSAVAASDLAGVVSVGIDLVVTDPVHPDVHGSELTTRVALTDVALAIARKAA